MSLSCVVKLREREKFSSVVLLYTTDSVCNRIPSGRSYHLSGAWIRKGGCFPESLRPLGRSRVIWVRN